jgi:hypothetical protein
MSRSGWPTAAAKHGGDIPRAKPRFRGLAGAPPSPADAPGSHARQPRPAHSPGTQARNSRPAHAPGSHARSGDRRRPFADEVDLDLRQLVEELLAQVRAEPSGDAPATLAADDDVSDAQAPRQLDQARGHIP